MHHDAVIHRRELEVCAVREHLFRNLPGEHGTGRRIASIGEPAAQVTAREQESASILEQVIPAQIPLEMLEQVRCVRGYEFQGPWPEPAERAKLSCRQAEIRETQRCRVGMPGDLVPSLSVLAAPGGEQPSRAFLIIREGCVQHGPQVMEVEYPERGATG